VTACGPPKALATFDAQADGDSHCQADNPRLGQEAVFDWLGEQTDSLPSPPVTQ
jgi:hypothetical protein